MGSGKRGDFSNFLPPKSEIFMPELFTLVPPDAARDTLFEHLPVEVRAETIPTVEALGRVTAAPLR